MKRLPYFLLILAVLLSSGCNKDLKEQLDQLQGRVAELQGSVKEMPDAAGKIISDNRITFDKNFYWVDAAGSVSVHYTLENPAEVEVAAEQGWLAEVTKQSDKEGDITVTAPDPASPGIITVKATGEGGASTESMVQIFVRNPYASAPHPRIETLAYNCFGTDLATPENFQKLAEAGMTMLTVEGEDLIDGPYWRNQCQMAQQVGVKVILFINYTAGLYSDDPENYKGLDALIAETKDIPAICAYQIADEPHTDKAYRLAAAKKRINELDPARPVYINLHPSTVSQAGMGAVTYEAYVDYFARVCDLEFITFDQYPVLLTGVEDSWYHSLNVVSSTAKKYGVPFWTFLLCSRLQRREDPTLENMRLQGNINLAYGSQCNQFFVWKCLSDSDYAPIMGDGTYREVYYQVKEYTREMRNREYIFAGGTVFNVRHIGSDYYLHGTHLDKSDLPEAIGDIRADGSALVSFIGNCGNEYVVVCNKSWQDKLSVDIDFTREVYTIDREGNFSFQQPGQARFTIDEGDFLAVKLK